MANGRVEITVNTNGLSLNSMGGVGDALYKNASGLWYKDPTLLEPATDNRAAINTWLNTVADNHVIIPPANGASFMVAHPGGLPANDGAITVTAGLKNLYGNGCRIVCNSDDRILAIRDWDDWYIEDLRLLGTTGKPMRTDTAKQALFIFRCDRIGGHNVHVEGGASFEVHECDDGEFTDCYITETNYEGYFVTDSRGIAFRRCEARSAFSLGRTEAAYRVRFIDCKGRDLFSNGYRFESSRACEALGGYVRRTQTGFAFYGAQGSFTPPWWDLAFTDGATENCVVDDVDFIDIIGPESDLSQRDPTYYVLGHGCVVGETKGLHRNNMWKRRKVEHTRNDLPLVADMVSGTNVKWDPDGDITAIEGAAPSSLTRVLNVPVSSDTAKVYLMDREAEVTAITHSGTVTEAEIDARDPVDGEVTALYVNFDANVNLENYDRSLSFDFYTTGTKLVDAATGGVLIRLWSGADRTGTNLGTATVHCDAQSFAYPAKVRWAPGADLSVVRCMEVLWMAQAGVEHKRMALSRIYAGLVPAAVYFHHKTNYQASVGPHLETGTFVGITLGDVDIRQESTIDPANAGYVPPFTTDHVWTVNQKALPIKVSEGTRFFVSDLGYEVRRVGPWYSGSYEAS